MTVFSSTKQGLFTIWSFGWTHHWSIYSDEWFNFNDLQMIVTNIQGPLILIPHRWISLLRSHKQLQLPFSLLVVRIDKFKFLAFVILVLLKPWLLFAVTFMWSHCWPLFFYDVLIITSRLKSCEKLCVCGLTACDFCHWWRQFMHLELCAIGEQIFICMYVCLMLNVSFRNQN